MWLIFSSESSAGDLYTHGLHYTDMEEHLDMLNCFVAAGYRLLSASLIDQAHSISLPLEAFDGQPMTDCLRGLQQQYHCILSA